MYVYTCMYTRRSRSCKDSIRFGLKGRRHLEIDLVWKDDVVDPAKTLLDLVWKDDVVDATKAA